MLSPHAHTGPRWRALIAVAVLAALTALLVLVHAASSGAAQHASPGSVQHTSSRAVAARKKHRSAKRSHAPLKLIWGPLTLPNRKSAFPIYHQLHVQVYQLDLSWASTAPTQPTDPTDPNDPAYRWPASVDNAVAQAKHYKIKVMLLVQGSPPWANGNQSSAWAPNNPQDYGNFLIAAAHRYRSVHLWMVWGEPNRDPQPDFEPMPSNSPTGPERYAVVLNAGYHALKSVSRKNIVIGGDTWSFGVVEPYDFVRWMKLPNGKAPPLDYYGHNPFGRRYPDLSETPYFYGGRDINDIDTLEQQLHGIYHRKVPLWLSEFTVSSDHNNFAFNFHVSRAAQARWLSAAFRLAGSVNYVAGMGWFSLLDGAPGPGSLTSGLMTYNLRHKPAFYAYERAK